MITNLRFPQKIIDNLQERIENLEKCLNDANSQDEAIAEIVELANTRNISFSQLQEQANKLQYKLNGLIQLSSAFNEQLTKGESSILLCVRCNFALKEILDMYWDFFLKKDGREILKELTENFVQVFNQIRLESGYELNSDRENEVYIIVESLKHLIISLIQNSLRFNALSEEEINAFNLGDITPKESEAMLISLASTKKWDQTYKNIANNHRKNTVESLLYFLKTSPEWVGDDFEECLEYVNEVRRQ